ncbi:MAG: hypothetical protein H6981_01715 [Gammaproteobacteria bacterium]|nr:hypothetical protein [Gammaproteobacteria bacterium]MCP5135505.1 hypothetical protein [Gammaproteobacteria bacterium]
MTAIVDQMPLMPKQKFPLPMDRDQCPRLSLGLAYRLSGFLLTPLT